MRKTWTPEQRAAHSARMKEVYAERGKRASARRQPTALRVVEEVPILDLPPTGKAGLAKITLTVTGESVTITIGG